MATLSVQITEKLNLNNKERGNVVTVDVSSVTQTYERVITVGTGEISILEFAAANAAGTITDGELQYLRVTNTASSGTVDLRITDSAGNKEYFVRIAAGESYLLFDAQLDCNTGSSDLGGTIALSNIDTIKAKASTDIDVEIMAAIT